MAPFPVPADKFILGFVTDCIPATDVDNLMGPFTDPVELDLFCNAWNVVAKFQESLPKYRHLLAIGIQQLVMTMSWVTLHFFNGQPLLPTFPKFITNHHRSNPNAPPLITGRNEVVAKVMVLLVSVILLTQGGCLPQCILGWHFPPQCRQPQSRPPQSRHPPGADQPEQTTRSRHPLPGSRHCPEQTPQEQIPSPWESNPSPGKETLAYGQ